MLHPILQRVQSIGGKVFTAGDWNLNIVGIRNPNGTPNKFDDVVHVLYRDGGQWVDRWWSVTTDPGTYWLENPMNKLGTAAVVADRQYPGLWKLGKHRGEHEGLVQVGEVAVHRDDNEDTKVDYREDNIQVGLFGINAHRSNATMTSVNVNRWSAGCQVWADPHAFDCFLTICKTQQRERGWDTFSYTLLNGGW